MLYSSERQRLATGIQIITVIERVHGTSSGTIVKDYSNNKTTQKDDVLLHFKTLKMAWEKSREINSLLESVLFVSKDIFHPSVIISSRPSSS